jgi:hypothetical protein
MFGLFGLFGKSRPLQALEAELREAGLHPQLVHESLKLTLLRFLPDRGRAARPDELRGAAEVLAFCIHGPADFAEATSRERAAAVERRLRAAPDYPEGVDAQVVLLAIQTDNCDPQVAAWFEVEESREA